MEEDRSEIEEFLVRAIAMGIRYHVASFPGKNSFPKIIHSARRRTANRFGSDLGKQPLNASPVVGSPLRVISENTHSFVRASVGSLAIHKLTH